MSEIKVNSIKGTGASTAAITVNSSDGTCTANITNNLGHKNIVINGDMRIAQRGTSSTSSGYHTVDRFKYTYSGTDNAPTQSQSDIAAGTTPYTLGFRKAYKITNANQSSGAGSGDRIRLEVNLEAQDIANSGWNYLSSSSFITLSFWCKSSVAQNFYASIRTPDGTSQNYSFETGSLTADTWTKVTKTIPGNSNLTFDNNAELGWNMEINMFTGTNTTSSGNTMNQWAAHDGSNEMPDKTSPWYTTNGATWEITGMQLEVGSVATDFEHRSIGDEQKKCYRYFQRLTSSDNYQWVSLVAFYADTEIHGFLKHFETMRAVPTLSVTTGSNTFAVQRAGGAVSWSTGIVKNGGDANMTYFYRDGVTLGTSGQCGRCLTWTAGSTITLESEL